MTKIVHDIDALYQKMWRDLEPLRLLAVKEMEEGSTEVSEVRHKSVRVRGAFPAVGTATSEKTQLILRLRLVNRDRPSTIAKRCGVSRQRVGAILRRELERATVAAITEMAPAYDDIVREARKCSGSHTPVAPVPREIDFHGTVIAVNAFYVAIFDSHAEVVRISSTSRLAWIPNVAARIRVRYVQGIGFIDGLEGGQKTSGEDHGK